jgi:hypothetical protein
MKNKRSFGSVIWKTFSLLLGSTMIILGIYLVLHYLLCFNYEELDSWELVHRLLSLAFLIWLFWHEMTSHIEVDMEQQLLYRKVRLFRREQLPFERITGYQTYPVTNSTAVFVEGVKHPLGFKDEPAFVDWLHENRTIKETRRWKNWIYVLWGSLLIGSILVIANRHEIDDFLRKQLPSTTVEVVEMTGSLKQSHFSRSSKTGPYSHASLELKEYPNIRFNISSLMPDEKKANTQVDLTNATLHLTVNKADYKLLVQYGPLAWIKGTVRTYGIRKGDEVLLAKYVGARK